MDFFLVEIDELMLGALDPFHVLGLFYLYLFLENQRSYKTIKFDLFDTFGCYTSIFKAS